MRNCLVKSISILTFFFLVEEVMRLLILVILALVAINFSDGMKWNNQTYSKFNETRGGPDDSGRGKRSANFNQTRGGGPDDSGRG